MQKRMLAILFLSVLFLTGFAVSDPEYTPPSKDEGAESPTVELQLMGVHLGTPYSKTKDHLTQQYGAPNAFGAFVLDKKTASVLMVYPSDKNSSAVGAIQVSGTKPVQGLDFFAGMNLGDDERLIPFLFPKAELSLKDGTHHYDIPFSNYTIEAKDGLVTAFRINDAHTTLFVRDGQSISLSGNLAFIANKRGQLTTLAADRLRPYCPKRYPLRLSATGAPYVDVSIYQDAWPNSVSATFLLDTGWSETTLSEALCQKLNCKELSRAQNSPSENATRVVSGGNISLGFTHPKIDHFKVHPSLSLLKELNIDGILGGNTLFTHPLFINFKQGYLCFPQASIASIAEKLNFKKVSARHASAVTWSDIYVNRKMLRNYLLDSGSDSTVLLKKEISLLNLKKLDAEVLGTTSRGTEPRALYDFSEVGWPYLYTTQRLTVTETANPNSRVLGMDFLRHYIISLDIGANYFYIGE